MQARAEAAADTQRRIVEAAMHAFSERLYDQVALEEIARRAGVTFQTVMRRFGSKEKLFAVAAATGRARVLTRRSQPPVGDLRAAVQHIAEIMRATRWDASSLLARLEHADVKGEKLTT